ncbi:homing endonuclease associated repeat-containing protein [Natrialbaceae archaeon GCM10025896]
MSISTLEAARVSYTSAIDIADEAGFDTEGLENERSDVVAAIERRDEKAADQSADDDDQENTQSSPTQEEASPQEDGSTTSLTDLTDELRRVDSATNGYPKPAALRIHGRLEPDQYYEVFGSWDEALEAAGIDKEQRLLDVLRRVAEKVDGVPDKADVDKYVNSGHSSDVYSKIFGSWDNALTEAGVDDSGAAGTSETETDTSAKPDANADELEREQESDSTDDAHREELIAELQKLDDKWNSIDRKLLYSVSDYHPDDFLDVFGSLDTAMDEAGIGESRSEESESVQDEAGTLYRLESDSGMDTDELTKADYIEAIKEYADSTDQVVKSTDVSEQSPYSVQEMVQAFGTWQEALDEADVDNDRRLLQELRRVTDKLGHKPSTTEMNKHGHVSATMYADYFGTYTDAVSEAFSTEGGSVNRGADGTGEDDSGAADTRVTVTESSDDSDNEADERHGGKESDSSDQMRREELIAELQKLDGNWSHIDTKLLNSVSDYAPADFRDVFGSLDTAIDEAGVGATRSTESMLDVIERIAKKLGRAPKANELPEDCKYSQYDYRTEFGSWDEALEAAGIDREKSMLKEIEQVAEKLGRVPSTGDIEKHGAYSSGDYSKYFDSWSVALKRAGLNQDPDSGSCSHEREAMLKVVRHLNNRLGRAPKTTELPENCGYSTNDFYEEFGSWDETLQAAGINKEQDMLNEIQRVAEKLGRIPNTDDMNEHGAYSSYSSYFDSWSTALEKSGIKKEFAQNTEKEREEKIEILQSLHRRLDRPPKASELPEECEYSRYDYRTEFGSWDEALEAAGIDKKQALLDDIKRIAENLGHVPNSTDMDEHGIYSYSYYSSYFGSWGEALEAADLSSVDTNTASEQTSKPHSGTSWSSSSTPAASSNQLQSTALDTSWETIPANERIDSQFLIQVADVDKRVGNQKTAQLDVRDQNGREIKMNIWSKHNIDRDWTEGEWYALENARGKVWESNDGTTRKQLSSTKDLNVIELGPDFTPNTASTEDTSETASETEKSGATTDEVVSKSNTGRSTVNERNAVTNNKSPSLSELWMEFQRVAERLGHLPNYNEFDKMANYSGGHLTSRVGTWEEVKESYRDWATETGQDPVTTATESKEESEMGGMDACKTETSPEEGDTESGGILGEISEEFDDL